MVRLIDRVDSLAHSEAAVLITGEAGTGKELVARTLHTRSARRAAPFVVANCGAFPDAMLEAELFGYERSPFPVAPRRRTGHLRAADGGTLLLRDVGKLPLAGQAKLLAALQSGVLLPIGATSELPFDARVIAASALELKAAVQAGTFREDLYYRLSVLEIHLPPLRERRADLPMLLQHFLQRFTPAGQMPPGITPRAWALLSDYPFPGNVREFAQTVERAVALARGGEIDEAHLCEDIVGAARAVRVTPTGFQPLRDVLKEVEREHVLRALHLAGGKRARAAQLLGISRKSLWEKLMHHGLSDLRVDQGA
jgi:DNA-binding NtrC family response regulator